MRYCPHCLEIVPDEDAGANPLTHCPRCTAALDPDSQEPAPPREYGVEGQEEHAHQSANVREYVQSLEKSARQDRKRKPYHRSRAPIGLITGLVLIGIGIALLLNAFLGEGGYMSALINGVLLSSVFILAGVCCLIFREK
jgi:hypothetical protein